MYICIYIKQNKMQIRKSKNPWMIHPKDIYGLYQEDNINAGVKMTFLVSVSIKLKIQTFPRHILLIKAINVFWVCYSWFLLFPVFILFCYFIFDVSFSLHFTQLDDKFDFRFWLVYTFFLTSRPQFVYFFHTWKRNSFHQLFILIFQTTLTVIHKSKFSNYFLVHFLLSESYEISSSFLENFGLSNSNNR